MPIATPAHALALGAADAAGALVVPRTPSVLVQPSAIEAENQGRVHRRSGISNRHVVSITRSEEVPTLRGAPSARASSALPPAEYETSNPFSTGHAVPTESCARNVQSGSARPAARTNNHLMEVAFVSAPLRARYRVCPGQHSRRWRPSLWVQHQCGVPDIARRDDP
jgi:hypothetical protein